MEPPVNWFLREKPDGRRAAGYGVYLLAGLAVLGGIVILRQRFVAGPGARTAARARSSQVAPITQPAATMTRIEVRNAPPPPETRSYRLDQRPPPPPGPPAPSVPADFDAITAALAELPPSEARATSETGPPRSLDERAAGRRREAASAYPDLPPAFAAEGSPEARPLAYRDPLEGAAAEGSRPEEGGDDGGAAVVPRGTLIRVTLLTTVDTSAPPAILELAAARSLVFHHRRQIPFGTRFLGKLSGPPVRDRVNLAVSTVLYPDGLELPISATAVEADEDGSNLRPGVGARYFPPPTWVQLAPYLSDVVTGYLGLLETRAQPQVSVGLGGLAVQTASAEPRTAAYQASAQALQDLTQARLKELEQRYASYYLVPAGTACWLQLEADLDLGAGGAGRGFQPGRR